MAPSRAVGEQVADDHRRTTSGQCRQCPAGAADVEERHGDEGDHVRADVEDLVGRLEDAGEIAGRQAPHPWEGRSCPRCRAGWTGSSSVGSKPGSLASPPDIRSRQSPQLVDAHPGAHIGHRCRDLLAGPVVVGSEEENGSVGVVDDGRHLGGGQAPVDRDHHRPDQRGAEEDLEELDAVPVEEGDPVAGPDPVGQKSPTGPPRPLVHLGPGDRALVTHEHRSVGRLAGPVAEHAGRRVKSGSLG